MIYLTGDTHNMIDGGKLFGAAYIKEGDYLIVCGDFGFIWATNPKDGEELKTLRKLEKLPYTILFIDGNHENFDRLFSDEFELVDMFGSKVRRIRSNIYHLQRGERYIIEGHSFLTIGGAMSIDKYRRTEHRSWWSQELLSKADEDKILKAIQQNSNFDYVLSHAAPISIARKIFASSLLSDFATHPKLQDPVSLFLEQLIPQISFKCWFCGHYHIEKLFELGDGEIKLLYNEIINLEFPRIS